MAFEMIPRGAYTTIQLNTTASFDSKWNLSGLDKGSEKRALDMYFLQILAGFGVDSSRAQAYTVRIFLSPQEGREEWYGMDFLGSIPSEDRSTEIIMWILHLVNLDS